MDLHDQVDFDTRSYNIRTCDFTLMKFLLESTFAASVIFGHACHAKTVVVPRKIADSPLDLTKTACVVPGCSVVAAWRTVGSYAVFPTDAVHTAFPSPRRWCWVDPPQNRASHPHHPQAPRIHIIRKLLASPSRLHLQPSFSVRLTLVEFSTSITTLACLGLCSTVKEWHTVHRLLVPRDAIQHSDLFPSDQIRLHQASLKANHSKSSPSARITRSSPSRDNVMSLSLWFCTNSSWAFTISTSRLSSSSPPCLRFHTCCWTRINTCQASLTDNRKPIGGCTSWTPCFSSSFCSPASTPVWTRTLHRARYQEVFLLEVEGSWTPFAPIMTGFEPGVWNRATHLMSQHFVPIGIAYE